MSEIPALYDVCWPVDISCCSVWDDYESDVQDRAVALATTTLRALTLNRVGGCPTTVRPCAGQDCAGVAASLMWSGTVYTPLNWNGVWTNCGCAQACIHNAIELPTPVGTIDSIKIDGVALTVGSWRLLEGKYLIRSDGQPWPTVQDMTLPDTEADTWSITYLRGYPVDGLGAYVAGVLACEYAKACSGKACSLPTGVVSIARAGISMQITPGAFPDGNTGIREVDAYIRQFNPNGLRTAPVVWSPMRRNRSISWQ